jgi:hypothetical protein
MDLSRREAGPRTPELRPQTYATQELQNQPGCSTEVDKYIDEQMCAALAAEYGEGGSVADAGDYLSIWSSEVERAEAAGQTSRIAYLGMVAAAKVVSNGAIESALSIAKRLSGVDRQRMTAASLQYSFMGAEGVTIAAPNLCVLIHRWVNRRKHGAGIPLRFRPGRAFSIVPGRSAGGAGLRMGTTWSIHAATRFGVCTPKHRGRRCVDSRAVHRRG